MTWVAALLAVLVVPVALGAVAPQPGQRIDLRVLLVSATGTEATFGAWKAQLDREGVPYDAIIADIPTASSATPGWPTTAQTARGMRP